MLSYFDVLLTVYLSICTSVFNQLDAQNLFTTSFISCLYMFRAHVLFIRRSKLHYTASGIITKERWHGKRMHGQLPRNLDEKLVDIEQSYRWLKSGDIKGQTESTIVAAQYQAISILRIKF